MAGTTSLPINHRPPCDECGEHRWSWDGRCLSVVCAPLPWVAETRVVREPRERSVSSRDRVLMDRYREAMKNDG